MKQRTITALVMAALFLPILLLGHYFYLFAVFCGLLSVYGTIEITKVADKASSLPRFMMILAPVVAGAMYIFAYLMLDRLIPGVTIAVYLGLAVLVVMTINLFVTHNLHRNRLYLLIISVYVGVAFAGLSTIRGIGLLHIIYVLLTAMLTDTFAYFIGVKYGKHRLAEKISPKKSIEGAIAGLVIGGGLASLFAIFLKLFAMHWALVVLLSFGLSLIGQIGDLVKSKIKRDYGVKDFSNLFPGHGGIMDRFDSWTFTALGLVVIAELFNIVFTL